jgi:hypothetical protein
MLKGYPKVYDGETFYTRRHLTQYLAKKLGRSWNSVEAAFIRRCDEDIPRLLEWHEHHPVHPQKPSQLELPLGAIPITEIVETLGPLVEALEEEGRKHIALASPVTIACLATLLKRHIEHWSGEPLPRTGRRGDALFLSAPRTKRRVSSVNAETVPLTRELANQFHTMEPSPTERMFDEGHYRHLRAKALGGQLVNFQWSIAQCGNQLFRMNGQHSSKMLCDLDGNFPEGLFVHVDTYKVENDEELALLFRQFDDRKSGRSPADVSGAYQMLIPVLKAVPRLSAKIAIEGVNWWRRSIEGLPAKQGDDIYSTYADTTLHPFIIWMGELLTSKTNELKRIPVMAAAYATFITNERAAREFWKLVARGDDDYEEHSPAKTLDDWLRELADSAELRRKIAVKPGNFWQGCIYGWNAHRGGKQISKINFDTQKGFLEVNQ